MTLKGGVAFHFFNFIPHGRDGREVFNYGGGIVFVQDLPQDGPLINFSRWRIGGQEVRWGHC